MNSYTHGIVFIAKCIGVIGQSADLFYFGIHAYYGNSLEIINENNPSPSVSNE